VIFWRQHGVFMPGSKWCSDRAKPVVLLERMWVPQTRSATQPVTCKLTRRPCDIWLRNIPAAPRKVLVTALDAGECVVYVVAAQSCRACLNSLLGPRRRVKLQCDGYSAYPRLPKTSPGVIRCGCLAHARRGFFEAREQAPAITGWLLNQIDL